MTFRKTFRMVFRMTFRMVFRMIFTVELQLRLVYRMAFRIRMPFKIVPYCSFVTQCFLDCIIWHEHESGKYFIATKETERVRQETLQ